MTTKLNAICNFFWEYTPAVVALAVGLFFFYHQLCRPSLDSSNDLSSIEGRIEDYSFARKRGYKRILKQYYIWLENHSCTFQIKADLIPFFYQKRFESHIKRGDSLKLTIPKEFANRLHDKNEEIFILSVSDDFMDYLPLKDSLTKENDKFDIYAGIFFIIGGGILYLLKRNKIIKE